MPANYVKFLRGTEAAYNSLATKDADTLYFVYQNADSSSGKLYLGTKLISGGSGGGTGVININDIGDVYIDNSTLADKDILVYDIVTHEWINSSIADLIANVSVSVMTGATSTNNGSAGLVPAPQSGDQNLFLAGDGTWKDPTTEVKTTISNLIGTAPDTLDTLGEIAAWIADDPTGSTALITRVGNLETALSSLGNVYALNSVVGNLSDLGNSYVAPSVGESTTIINEINYINEKLQWQTIPQNS